MPPLQEAHIMGIQSILGGKVHQVDGRHMCTGYEQLQNLGCGIRAQIRASHDGFSLCTIDPIVENFVSPNGVCVIKFEKVCSTRGGIVVRTTVHLGVRCSSVNWN